MPVDPVERCVQQLPGLYEQAKAELQELASAGDKRAQSRLADARGTRTCVRVLFEGEGGGELFLVQDAGLLRVLRERPAEPKVQYSLAAPVAAAQRALLLIDSGALPSERPAGLLPMLGSRKADQLLGMYKFGFELLLRELPGLGESHDMLLRVGLGRDLPTAAEFRLSVSYPDLQALHERGAGAQELFASGKLVITGDVAKAMMLGMTLSQLR